MKYPLDITECHKIMRAQEAKIEEQADELKAWADYDAGIGDPFLNQWAMNCYTELTRRLAPKPIYEKNGLIPAAARCLIALATRQDFMSKQRIWKIASLARFRENHMMKDDGNIKGTHVMIHKARKVLGELGFENPILNSFGVGYTLSPEARAWVNQFKPDNFKIWSQTLPKIPELPEFLKTDLAAGLMVLASSALWGLVFMGLVA